MAGRKGGDGTTGTNRAQREVNPMGSYNIIWLIVGILLIIVLLRVLGVV